MWGLVPAGAAALAMMLARPPDILVSGDGRNVGVIGETGEKLLVLREGRSDYARSNLAEIAGMSGEAVAFDAWPGASCNEDFCTIALKRGERSWNLLLSRGGINVPERALAAACARSDIVIADRWLPRSCRPAWLKADRALLSQTGGLAIDLTSRRVTSVAQSQGEHGWWRQATAPSPRPVPPRQPAGRTAAVPAAQ